MREEFEELLELVISKQYEEVKIKLGQVKNSDDLKSVLATLEVYNGYILYISSPDMKKFIMNEEYDNIVGRIKEAERNKMAEFAAELVKLDAIR